MYACRPVFCVDALPYVILVDCVLFLFVCFISSDAKMSMNVSRKFMPRGAVPILRPFYSPEKSPGVLVGNNVTTKWISSLMDCPV